MREMVGGCCVCSDESGWPDNPLVYCDGGGCSVAVHQACYGIQAVPTGPWYCRKCESHEKNMRVKCELCPQKEGALKKTDTQGWCHVLCGLYIPEAWFGNVQTMEPIVLKDVPADRFNKPCYVCEESGRASKSRTGACMQCNRLGCQNHFHVTCAQSNGLLCEESSVYVDNVKYCGYCKLHKDRAPSPDKDEVRQKSIPAFRTSSRLSPPPPVSVNSVPDAKIHKPTKKAKLSNDTYNSVSSPEIKADESDSSDDSSLSGSSSCDSDSDHSLKDTAALKSTDAVSSVFSGKTEVKETKKLEENAILPEPTYSYCFENFMKRAPSIPSPVSSSSGPPPPLGGVSTGGGGHAPSSKTPPTSGPPSASTTATKIASSSAAAAAASSNLTSTTPTSTSTAASGASTGGGATSRLSNATTKDIKKEHTEVTKSKSPKATAAAAAAAASSLESSTTSHRDTTTAASVSKEHPATDDKPTKHKDQPENRGRKRTASSSLGSASSSAPVPTTSSSSSRSTVTSRTTSNSASTRPSRGSTTSTPAPKTPTPAPKTPTRTAGSTTTTTRAAKSTAATKSPTRAASPIITRRKRNSSGRDNNTAATKPHLTKSPRLKSQTRSMSIKDETKETSKTTKRTEAVAAAAAAAVVEKCSAVNSSGSGFKISRRPSVPTFQSMFKSHKEAKEKKEAVLREEDKKYALPDDEPQAKSIEELLECQFIQGKHFLLEQGTFYDFASLIDTLERIHNENLVMENTIQLLTRRRDHLTDINYRLSLPSTLVAPVSLAASALFDVKPVDILLPGMEMKSSPTESSPDAGSTTPQSHRMTPDKTPPVNHSPQQSTNGKSTPSPTLTSLNSNTTTTSATTTLPSTSPAHSAGQLTALAEQFWSLQNQSGVLAQQLTPDQKNAYRLIQQQMLAATHPPPVQTPAPLTLPKTPNNRPPSRSATSTPKSLSTPPLSSAASTDPSDMKSTPPTSVTPPTPSATPTPTPTTSTAATIAAAPVATVSEKLSSN